MREASGQVRHKGVRGDRVARPDTPRRDQLGVGVDGNPRPYVAGFLRGARGLLDVLLLRVDELPDLVTLQASASKVVQRGILVVGADRSEIRNELEDGRL